MAAIQKKPGKTKSSIGTMSSTGIVILLDIDWRIMVIWMFQPSAICLFAESMLLEFENLNNFPSGTKSDYREKMVQIGHIRKTRI